MTRPRRATAALIALSALALLAGCTSGSEPTDSMSIAPTATTTPTPAPTPTPTPTPTLDAQDPSAPSTWLVTTSSIGPAKLGDVDEETLGLVFEPAFTVGQRCEGLTGYEPTAPSVPLRVFTAVSGDSTPEHPGYFRAVGVTAWEGARSGPVAESPRTEAGIGLGSSSDELAEAYPDLQSWQHPRAAAGDPTIYFVVSDADGSLLFTVDDGRVLAMTATLDLPPAGYCS